MKLEGINAIKLILNSPRYIYARINVVFRCPTNHLFKNAAP
jgi:hypothetical protein